MNVLTSPKAAEEILDTWSATTPIDESERKNIELVRRLDRRQEQR